VKDHGWLVVGAAFLVLSLGVRWALAIVCVAVFARWVLTTALVRSGR